MATAKKAALAKKTSAKKTPAKKAALKKTIAKSSGTKWSAKVDTDSTHPDQGLFLKGATAIANALMTTKVSPKGPASGMRMLNFYINRAGHNLPAARVKVLMRAKELLSAKIAAAKGTPVKTAAKKSSARKTAAKKTSAKKTATKKSPAKKTNA